MKIFGATISLRISNYLSKLLDEIVFFENANRKIAECFGISHFFENPQEFLLLKNAVSNLIDVAEDPDRSEYGDFQTNYQLSKSITLFLKNRGTAPKVIVEPTCGKGSFIIAALEFFPDVENIIGVEIYKPYIWETKFNIIQFYLEHHSIQKPSIDIIHFNVFDFNFKEIKNRINENEVLIIGNPPWVTNSKLSILNSENLPVKTNFKKHNGIDAITGKGNFDIGEYISLMMLDAFHNSKGNFAFIVKNSVIRNIIYDQKQARYRISQIEKLSIDSKKEFNVSVEAAILFCKLNSMPEFNCSEFDFYYPKSRIGQFGWIGNKFVSDIDHYKQSSDIDGVCPFEWRQGLKHDLTSVMELEITNGQMVNGFQEKVNIEDSLVYGLLKSSDLKQLVIDKTRKYTIVTQKKVSQETSSIKKNFPKTFAYLNSKKSLFDSRKSNIYNDKPDFSIFGIGDYSFAPYKIAISGLYKICRFSLILPQHGKPVMLDDTCYLIGFETIEPAAYTSILLNSEKVRELLKSITFSDAKRVYTKEVLMRIDLKKLVMQFSHEKIQDELNKLNETNHLNIRMNKWDEYLFMLNSLLKSQQFVLFT